MPDSNGRYFLSEMQDYVRRKALGVFLPVNPATGDEVAIPPAVPVYDMIFSTTDITKELNTALTLEMIKVNQLAEDAFISTVYLSTTANQASLSLPSDMLLIKEVSWMPPGGQNPWDWQPMPQLDQRDPQDFFGASDSPPWHRDGNLMVFDRPPVATTNGIRIRYVKWVPMLQRPTDVIQGQLARPMQEVIIIEAAVALMREKRRDVTQDMMQALADAQASLLMAASSITKPDSVTMTSPYMVRTGFSGRRSSWRWS